MQFAVIFEVVQGLAARGKWWLLPPIVILVLVGVLLVIAQASPLSVLIYGLL